MMKELLSLLSSKSSALVLTQGTQMVGLQCHDRRTSDATMSRQSIYISGFSLFLLFFRDGGKMKNAQKKNKIKREAKGKEGKGS